MALLESYDTFLDQIEAEFVKSFGFEKETYIAFDPKIETPEGILVGTHLDPENSEFVLYYQTPKNTVMEGLGGACLIAHGGEFLSMFDDHEKYLTYREVCYQTIELICEGAEVDKTINL